MGLFVSEARYFGFVAIGAAIVVIGLIIGVFIGPLYMPRYITTTASVTEKFTETKTETKVFTTYVPTTIFRTRSFTNYIPIHYTTTKLLTETWTFKVTKTWTKYIAGTVTKYITLTPMWEWDYLEKDELVVISPTRSYCMSFFMNEPGFLLVNYTASKEIYAEAIYRYQIFEGKTRYPEKGLAKQGVFIVPIVYNETILCFHNPWEERVELNLTIEYYRKEVP